METAGGAMPNGGSDNGGPCGYNEKNQGETGHRHIHDLGRDFCLIRRVSISVSLWTYCANHPYHNLKRVAFPVNPIYQCETTSKATYDRVILVPSQDTPAIREGLLALLASMEEVPPPELPSATQFDDEVITQLARFKEQRAVAGLLRVLAFDPFMWHRRPLEIDDAIVLGASPFKYRAYTIGAALEALAILKGDEVLPYVERFLTIGLDDDDPAMKRAAMALRYHALKALSCCDRHQARPLAMRALHDPEPAIRELAGPLVARLQ